MAGAAAALRSVASAWSGPLLLPWLACGRRCEWRKVIAEKRTRSRLDMFGKRKESPASNEFEIASGKLNCATAHLVMRGCRPSAPGFMNRLALPLNLRLTAQYAAGKQDTVQEVSSTLGIETAKAIYLRRD